MPGKAGWGLLVAFLLGCEERERLTFGNDPEDLAGPTCRIDPPSADTTVTGGDVVLVGVRAVDPTGVDSVFIEIAGANLSFPPVDGEGTDTVRFSVNLPTGEVADTVEVVAFGVDLAGNVGPRVSRRISVE